MIEHVIAVLCNGGSILRLPNEEAEKQIDQGTALERTMLLSQALNRGCNVVGGAVHITTRHSNDSLLSDQVACAANMAIALENGMFCVVLCGARMLGAIKAAVLALINERNPDLNTERVIFVTSDGPAFGLGVECITKQIVAAIESGDNVLTVEV